MSKSFGTDAPCGSGGPCFVFVTSDSYTGALGGLTGADDKCQRRADAVGLPGTYLAWLSDPFGGPAVGRFVQSTGPYVLVDGTTVAADWTDLTDGSLQAPIDLAESGVPVSGELVWTNTTPGGFAGSFGFADSCDGWSSSDDTVQGAVGVSGATVAAWTEDTPLTTPCQTPCRLYCFQQS